MPVLKLKETFYKSKSINVIREGDIIVIENNRKSRFIMKDAISLTEKILHTGLPIRNKIGFRSISPICSKSKVFLKEKGFKLL